MPMRMNHRPVERRKVAAGVSQALTPLITVVPQRAIPMPVIDWTNRPRRFMNPGELEVLCGLISTVKPKAVLEFGVNVGRTAQAILEYVPGIERYVGIDVPQGFVTPKEVQRGEVPDRPGELVMMDPRFQLLLHPQGSAYVHPTDLPICDAAFIDGDHSRSGVLADTMLSLQVVRKGGLIIWHDYHTLGTVDVKSVLDEKQEQGWPLFHVENTWIVFMSA